MQVHEFHEAQASHVLAPAIDRDVFGNAVESQSAYDKILKRAEQHGENARKKRLERMAEKRANSKTNRKNPIRRPEPPTAAELEFRHSNWKYKRALVRAAMAATGTGLNAMEAFDHCGSESIVYYHPEEKRYRVGGKFCHNRFCEPCMRAKGNLMAANLRNKLEQYEPRQMRFFTFTLKHSDTPLAKQLDRLYDSFRKLRALPIWKDSQKGGATILEIKWSPDTAEWHPHLHCIVEGEFVTQQAIRDTWLKITGDSYIVDVRALDTKKDTAYYLAKYVAKGCNDAMWNNEGAREEFVTATRGRRTCATFGTWRGFKLLAQPERKEGWTRIGSLDEIVAAANRNEAWAVKLVDKLYHEMMYDPHRKRSKQKPPVV